MYFTHIYICEADSYAIVLHSYHQAADYSYPPEYWGEVSGSAKDLIDHLLVVDPVQRYTCEQVLNHPWMTNTIGEDRFVVCVSVCCLLLCGTR